MIQNLLFLWEITSHSQIQRLISNRYGPKLIKPTIKILAIWVFIKELPIGHVCPCVTSKRDHIHTQLTLVSPKYNFQHTNVPELGDKI